ncbi:MAG: circularly permuted type 2 ATP-grasp protein, partial [Verrucomicrobiales bacterium]|nr:circularly permuted type 2 ATP-grasp protein [Verrucomicrobiales bacterium]
MFENYQQETFFDEMFREGEHPRNHYESVHDRFSRLTLEELEQRQREVDRGFLEQGITFTVYDDDQGTERIFPFDLIPRIIPDGEWRTLEAGLTQRIIALNLFLHDIYHEGKILSDGVIPRDIILSAAHYRPEMCGVDVPRDIYIHICGSDLIRDG